MSRSVAGPRARLIRSSFMAIALFAAVVTISPPALAASGDIAGTVFDDVDADGAMASDVGLAGVTVTAYDGTNTAVATTTTGADGTYVLSGLADGTEYRIEFSNFPDGYTDGPQGPDSRTSVTFATPEASNIDFGLHEPQDVPCTADPAALIRDFAMVATCTPETADDFVISLDAAQNLAFQAGSQTVGMFTHPDWTSRRLGTVNFTELDSGGNIFVPAAGISGTSRFGGANHQYGEIGGSDAVYKLDSVTGAPTEWASLPQAGAGDSDIGMAGITYDSSTDSMYVANLFDGGIYRITGSADPTGAVQPDVFTPVLAAQRTFQPRPIGLEVHNGRLYYTVADSSLGGTLVVRSAAIGADGAIDPLSDRLEISEQIHASTGRSTAPVSGDIEIHPTTGKMAVGTWSSIDLFALSVYDRGGTYRTMYNHASPGYVFEDQGGTWTRTAKTSVAQVGHPEGRPNSSNTLGTAWSLDPTETETVWFSGGDFDGENGNWGVVGYDVASLDNAFGLEDSASYKQFLFPNQQWGFQNDPKGNGGDVDIFHCEAGEADSIQIGNRVWFDANNDGVQDPGEPALEGVTVSLFDDTGTEIATTTTGPDGQYYFGQGDGVLPESTYDIVFDVGSTTTSLPGGAMASDLVETVPNSGVGDTADLHDSDIVDGAVTVVTGTFGQNDHSIDAGFYVELDNRIGNLVWLDSNNNAVVDIDEPGIEGLTVELYIENGDTPGFDAVDTLVSTTTTDATGNYWFDDLLEGETYYVAVPADQSASTLIIDGQQITMDQITSSTGGDLGNNDVDNVDDGDPATGFASVSGPVDLADASEVTGETDANTLTDAETYVEAAGAPDRDDNNSNLTVDLGFAPTNRIGNLVWLDGLDGQFGYNDGIAQPSESGNGIGNVSIVLMLDSATEGTPGVFEPEFDLVVDTTTTDADGSYWFDGVPDGTYFVAIPAGQTGQTIAGETADLDDLTSSTAPTSDANAGIDDRDDGDPAPGFASLSGPIEVAASTNPTDEAGDFEDPTGDAAETDINTKGTPYFDENSDLTIDFSFVEAPKYSLGNLVWVDSNDNGIAEVGESGVEGVSVELYDSANNLVDVTTTDANGNYLFEDLAAGDYQVFIPDGQTGQTISGGPVDLQDLLPSSVTVTDPDDPEDVDNDHNGVDEGNGLRSGVVSLGDPDPLNPFEPNNETVRADDPADDDDGGTTSDAQRNLTVDFGFVEPLRVGNLVWLDDGGASSGTYSATDEDDGQADANEVGIEGVLVQLLDDTDTVIAETVTDPNGNYWFDALRAGVYQVGVPSDQTPLLGNQPTIITGALDGVASSTGQTADSEAGDDVDDGDPAGGFASLSLPFNLDFGTEPTAETGDFVDDTPEAAETAANAATANRADANSNLQIDLGFAPIPTYRIGNLVWLETDDDGVANETGSGLPGVLVQLLDDTGTVIAETVTDVEGLYLFDELLAGDYQVRIPADQNATLGGPDGTPNLLDVLTTAGVPEPNADGDVDNDSNGVEGPDGLTSGLVTLGGDPEPTGETSRDNDTTLDEDGSLPDDRSNLTIDFGLTPLYRLGNLVWEDFDNDGLAEDGEPAIPGVLVQLLDDAGAVIAETVTDSDGHYEFSGLEAGSYQVRLPGAQTPELGAQPELVAGAIDGMTTSGVPNADANDGTDNDNNGVQDGADLTSGVVTLGDGSGRDEPLDETLRLDGIPGVDEDGAYLDDVSDLTIDFGLFRGLRLGNQVFLDGQQGEPGYNNGVFDDGEVGISGVDVELWLDEDDDGVFDPGTDTLVDTVTTDSEGNYWFDNVQPDTPYFVAVDDVGEGLATTEPLTDTPVTEDNDNDGAADPTTGYDSVTDVVMLTTGARTTGELDTIPVADDLAETEANTAGSFYPDTNSELTVDLGFIDVPLYRIGNLVWEDVDNDGTAEVGEAGIAGVTVNLLDDTGEIIATTTTDGDGKYEFPLLTAGQYQVSIPMDQAVLEGKESSNNGEDTDPNGLTGADNNDNGLVDGDAWTSAIIDLGVDTAPFGSEPVDETLRAGGLPVDDDPDGGFYGDDQSNITVDFGFLDVPTYSLGNLIWLDLDDNGSADAGEPGIADVTVELYDDADNLVDTTRTGVDGTYLFEDLPAGEYRVALPAGQTGQTVADGTNRVVDLENLLSSSVEIADPQDDVDNDNNGLRQADGSITTGLLSVGLPDPLNPDEPQSEVNRDGGDDDDGGSTTDAQRNLTLDIGLVEPLRVGNLVWLDDGNVTAGYDSTLEDNGIADGGEQGIEGVLVQLLDDTNAVIAETVTTATGNYWFDGLRAGDYTVGIPEDQAPVLGDQPDIVPGATDGLRSSTGISAAGEDGDNDDDGDPATGFLTVSETFTLDYRQEATDELGDFEDTTVGAAEAAADLGTSPYLNDNSNLEIDLGLSPEPLYRLGNLVWEDFDNDGLAEDGEPAIVGVQVQLLDDTGQVIAETTTDAEGHYSFADLEAGDYQVRIPGNQPVLDEMQTSGTPNASADDDTDNDNNGVEDGDDFTSGIVSLGEGTGNEEPLDESLRDGLTDPSELDEDGTLRDDRSNLTVDFGFFRGLRLGNQIFLDGEQGDPGYDDGLFNPELGGDMEVGISGVDVTLWLDDGDDVFDPALDTLLQTSTTDSEGNYLFENLNPDTPYFVAVEDIGEGASSSPVVTDTPTTDDNDDDGSPSQGFDSVTSAFTLSVGSTSLGEVDASPTGDELSDLEADARGDFYPDENSEMQVDLGFIDVPLYRIGNLVWDDVDNNGSADDGEEGIDGVTVLLLDSAGAVIAETVTTGGGKYEFPRLLAGDYQVSIPMDQPALDGKASSNNNEEVDPNGLTGADNNDNGLIDGDAWTSGVVSVGEGGSPGNFGTEPIDETLRADGTPVDDDPDVGFYGDDQSNFTVDFGFLDIPQYEIGNLVWVDSNDDGVADIGEPGIGGVVVELYDDSGGLVDTTTTESDGSYLFDGLDAGDYQVVIPANQTGQTIDDGGAGEPVDLQDLLPSSIVSSDPDDPADVDNDSNGVEQVDGSVRSGFVSVGDPDPLNPAEPIDETSRAGGPDIDTNDDVDDARQNGTVDFGFAEPLRIGNLVWLDDGNAAGPYVAENQDNGIADSGEVGLEGVLVQLLDDADAVIAETVTDAAGNYWFDGLRRGDYRVGVPTDQTPVLADLSGIVEGALDGLVSSTGQSASAEVADDDDDGDPAPGYITVSDPFNLDYNTEAVDETGDFGDGTTGAAETAANDATYDHRNANSNLEIDLGLTPPPVYRLGNQVWEDIDNDGVAEEGEPGIGGVLVQLLDETGSVVAETVTDSSGQYEFLDLQAGDYQVRLPADQTPTLGDQPMANESALDGLSTSGTPNANADDGADNDNNGVETPEGLTSGVVTLGDGDTKDEPTGETARDDSTALAEDGTLPDDRSDLTVDFGLFRGLRLGNQVFLDGQQGEPGYNNGLFDPGEVGISGVEVELWLDDGDDTFDPQLDTLISTVATDSEGNYFFDNLDEGVTYFVGIADVGAGAASETVSADATSTDNDNDGAPQAGYDSVSGPVVLMTGQATLGEVDAIPVDDGPADSEADLRGNGYPDGNSEMTVDFGFIDVPLYRLGNLVWEDLDNDGLAEANEPGIADVVVDLLDSNGTVISSTTTDSVGSYEFPNLVAGTYRVSINMDQPAIEDYASSNQGEEIDPNNDGDNNDNGLDDGDRRTSGPVDVGPDPLVGPFGSEPSDETLRSDDPTDDDDDTGFYLDDRSNFSVDFGFYQLSLGSQVWLDLDGNGTLDVGEQGINDVPLNLYEVLDDGTLSKVDETVTSTIAGQPGSYIFTGLEDDKEYVVEIPSAAFDGGGPLEGLHSSPDPLAGSPDPDDVPTDGDDNGIDAMPGDPVRSLPVTLNVDGEPEGEPSLETGVPDANENLGVDFGVAGLSLGGTLWEDADKDGQLGSSEQLLSGVPVELWDVDPTTGEVIGTSPLASTTTDSNGEYAFIGLTPGDFVVRVPIEAFSVGAPLDSLTSTIGNGVVPPDPDDDADNDDNGALTLEGWVQTAPVSLDYNDEPTGEPETGPAGGVNDNHTVDLGFVEPPPMSIGNRVFTDTNGNGVLDETESGIGDVELELVDVQTQEVIDRATTDENGYYLFENVLPGTYVVRIPASNFGAGGPLSGLETSSAFVGRDPNVDRTDSDDQGDEVGDAVESPPITLLPTFEPTADFETDLPEQAHGAAADIDSNLTVDFGFVVAVVPVQPVGSPVGGTTSGGFGGFTTTPATAQSPAVPDSPLALTGGTRQVHQLLLALASLGGGFAMLGFGRHRRMRRDDW